jgi:ATP-dependent Lon protease
MGPKKRKSDQVGLIILPFPKKANNYFNKYDDNEEYDEDYEEDYEEEDDEDNEEDDEDDEEDDEDDEEEDDDDDDEDKKYNKKESNDNNTILNSKKWKEDEFDKETNDIFIEKNIRLNMRVNLEKLWTDGILTEDEIEIVNNNLKNIGIIIFNKIYNEHSSKKLIKILNKLNEITNKIKKNTDSNDYLINTITKECNTIINKFKKEIVNIKKDSEFDVIKFTIENYNNMIYDERITKKFFNKYQNFNINMNTSKYFKKLSTDEKKSYYDKMENLFNDSPNDKSIYFDMLDKEGLDNESRIAILKKIKECEDSDDHDSSKLESWLKKINEIPFGKVKKLDVNKDDNPNIIKKFLENGKKCLDDSIYGQEKVKNDIMRIMGKFIMNDCGSGNIIALEGPPGIGKTEIIKNGLSKAMGIPCAFIPLGGLTDSSYLHGHDYTYTGSDHGKIVDILRQTKHMNPIIFFDELDKVSECQKGDEIMNILMQITDPTQSDKFQDKYFRGINFDLSKCLIVFSFNNCEKISHILLNRMNIIKIPSLKTCQKVIIAKNFLIPKIMKESNIDYFKIDISDELINHIVEKYTFEGGVRKLKDRLNEIILEINLRKLSKGKINGKFVTNSITLTEEIIDSDLLKDRYKFDHEKKCKVPKIGLVNGMWANDAGVGGLTPIQCSWIPSDKKLGLELTGLQGKTMKESMSVARTVAWKLLPDNIKLKYNNDWKESDLFGIHVHVPDAGTSKDGPSAGIAITTCMISLFTNIKCNPNISITGEIDINGTAKAIGGLDDKFYGVKREGIKLSLYPEENQRDVDEILKNYPNLVDDTFQIKSYKNIYEALQYTLEGQLEWNQI